MSSFEKKSVMSRLICYVFWFFVTTPQTLLAAEFTLLEGDLPGIGESPGLSSYLGGVFNLSIGIAVTLAVLVITIQGVKYMFSDAGGVKTEAKSRIWDALLGVVIIAVAWILLNTINPDLVKFNFLSG